MFFFLAGWCFMLSTYKAFQTLKNLHHVPRLNCETFLFMFTVPFSCSRPYWLPFLVCLFQGFGADIVLSSSDARLRRAASTECRGPFRKLGLWASLCDQGRNPQEKQLIAQLSSRNKATKPSKHLVLVSDGTEFSSQ